MNPHKIRQLWRPFVGLFLLSTIASVQLAHAQLRVANWNVTNYSSGRVADFQTSLYGSFGGRQFAPDVLMAEEFLNAASVANFLSILNTAIGSPGDWAAAPFVDGADTESVFFYRTSKVQYLGMKIVAVGGPSPNQPRNTYRYDVRPIGYGGPAATIAMYAVHLKAGSTSADNARRLVETQRIRTDAQSLPAGWQFLIGGDFNMQSSSQTSYQELVVSRTDNTGRFFDPINSPGNWDNNAAFRFIHTQEQSTAMDSRYDFILLCGGLIDGDGMDYIGDATKAYSTSTWYDPNHSYRCWGNDGSSFNAPLTTTGNTMVGPVIAQALINSASGNGHLPVFLDLKVPGRLDVSSSVIDFGLVDQGSEAGSAFEVWNSADASLWGVAGIADLKYSVGASTGFSTAPGPFYDSAEAGRNTHVVRIDTSEAGLKTGWITITSNATDEPIKTIAVQGTVVGIWGGPKQGRFPGIRTPRGRS